MTAACRESFLARWNALVGETIATPGCSHELSELARVTQAELNTKHTSPAGPFTQPIIQHRERLWAAGSREDVPRRLAEDVPLRAFEQLIRAGVDERLAVVAACREKPEEESVAIVSVFELFCMARGPLDFREFAALALTVFEQLHPHCMRLWNEHQDMAPLRALWTGFRMPERNTVELEGFATRALTAQIQRTLEIFAAGEDPHGSVRSQTVYAVNGYGMRESLYEGPSPALPLIPILLELILARRDDETHPAFAFTLTVAHVVAAIRRECPTKDGSRGALDAILDPFIDGNLTSPSWTARAAAAELSDTHDFTRRNLSLPRLQKIATLLTTDPNLEVRTICAKNMRDMIAYHRKNAPQGTSFFEGEIPVKLSWFEDHPDVVETLLGAIAHAQFYVHDSMALSVADAAQILPLVSRMYFELDMSVDNGDTFVTFLGQPAYLRPDQVIATAQMFIDTFNRLKEERFAQGIAPRSLAKLCAQLIRDCDLHWDASLPEDVQILLADCRSSRFFRPPPAEIRRLCDCMVVLGDLSIALYVHAPEAIRAIFMICQDVAVAVGSQPCGGLRKMARYLQSLINKLIGKVAADVSAPFVRDFGGPIVMTCIDIFGQGKSKLDYELEPIMQLLAVEREGVEPLPWIGTAIQRASAKIQPTTATLSPFQVLLTLIESRAHAANDQILAQVPGWTDSFIQVVRRANYAPDYVRACDYLFGKILLRWLRVVKHAARRQFSPPHETSMALFQIAVDYLLQAVEAMETGERRASYAVDTPRGVLDRVVKACHRNEATAAIVLPHLQTLCRLTNSQDRFGNRSDPDLAQKILNVFPNVELPTLHAVIEAHAAWMREIRNPERQREGLRHLRALMNLDDAVVHFAPEIMAGIEQLNREDAAAAEAAAIAADQAVPPAAAADPVVEAAAAAAELDDLVDMDEA